MLSVRLLYFFLFLIVFSCQSCRQTTKEILYSGPLRDSTSTFIIPQPDNIQNFTAELSNMSDTVVRFYITPSEADLFNTASIVRSLLNEASSDSAKALTLFHFVCDYYFHGYRAPTQCAEPHNPAILLNSLESGYCDDASAVLANLGKAAGLTTRVIELSGHVVMEFFYNDNWHLFDPDKKVYYQNNNGEIAGINQLYAAPERLTEGLVSRYQNRSVLELVKQQNKHLILSKGDNTFSDWYQDLFIDYNSTVTLKANEQIVFNLCSNSYLKKKVLVEWAESRRRYYQRSGYLIRKIKWPLSSAVYIEKSPYAINQICISANSTKEDVPTKVFYSSDSSHWYFKGIISTSSSVCFNPNTNPYQQLTFRYYLKFEKLSKPNRQAPEQYITVKNRFVFSDKIFFNNSTHSFMVKSVGSNYSQIKAHIQIERKHQ